MTEIRQGGRRSGKTALMLDGLRAALASGAHAHLALRTGVLCVDGPQDCGAEHVSIEQARERLREPQGNFSPDRPENA